MTLTVGSRGAMPRRVPGAVFGVGVVVVALAVGVAGSRFAPPPGRPWPALIGVDVTVEVSYAVAAMLLAREPGQRGNAMLLGAATACAVAGASQTPLPGPWTFLATVVGPLFWVFAGWALLRYPGNRLQLASERVFIVAACVWLGAGHTVGNLFLAPRWYPQRWSPSTWWPVAASSEQLYTRVQLVVVSVDAVVALWYVSLVVRRIRRMGGVDRWILAPMGASVAAAAVPLLLRPPSMLLHLDAVTRWLDVAQNGALLLIPAAFITVLVRARFTRSAIADIVTSLTQDLAEPDIAAALRTALRDPYLQIAFWMDDTGEYVDPTGHPVGLDPSRLLVPLTASDGATLGVVLADRRLAQHRDLVDAAVSACRLTLENARLHATLRAQLEEVKASRRRAAEAAVAERRRLERDLHDGVQQRLLALTLQLADMRARGDDTATVIQRTRDQLHAALHELRELARGIHPGVLSQSGLGPALEDVVDRLPVPVRLQVEPRRLPPAIEAVGYFLVCESLSNTVKHADAAHVLVRVHTDEDGAVGIEVTDDGRGGADVLRGTGLAGLHDRVRALGGRLVVHSPLGGGTSVRATIPCA